MKEQEISKKELPQVLLGLIGLMQLRQRCNERCADELAQEEQRCSAKYDVLSAEWNECMAEALMDYYHCTEDCPPKEIPFDIPWIEKPL